MEFMMTRMGIKDTLYRAVLVSGFLLLTVSAAFSQAPDRHPVLQKFEAEGGKVEFLGHAYGTDGWIVTNPQGGVQYAYTTPEGGMLVGMMFAPDGTFETQKQLESYKKRIEGVSQAAAPGAEASVSAAEKFYAETEKSDWVSIGSSAAPYLYAFMNVNCEHCQTFWKDLEGVVVQGKLQVRFVPFGSMEANRDGGAALLSVEKPDEAWRTYMGGDKTALGKDKVRDGAYQKVDKNTALAQQWKAAAPPYILYRRLGDGKVVAIVGRPENIMLLLAEFLK